MEPRRGARAAAAEARRHVAGLAAVGLARALRVRWHGPAAAAWPAEHVGGEVDVVVEDAEVLLQRRADVHACSSAICDEMKSLTRCNCAARRHRFDRAGAVSAERVHAIAEFVRPPTSCGIHTAGGLSQSVRGGRAASAHRSRWTRAAASPTARSSP